MEPNNGSLEEVLANIFWVSIGFLLCVLSALFWVPIIKFVWAYYFGA